MTRRRTQQPRRLRRSESFLGIHFDKHMNEHCTRVGENVTRKMVARIIDLVGPDYLQVDCKGHRGLCSYPTKVGHPAPGFVRDQLRIWRDVTAERGVALYMHYSGVLDREAVKRHPQWAGVDAAGKRAHRATSVFGPYVDKLLIPQLKELRDEYGVDGIWLDGECWGVMWDYSRWAKKAWRETGNDAPLPKGPDDPNWPRFAAFCREGFREYLRHYVDELHRHDPDYQLASNWAFSSMMPEPVSADVDFLSGDYSLADSINAARWEGRCLARQGLAWDLMAWGFGGTMAGPGKQATKTPVQLKQEAAVVLALGGGFQAYYKQKDDASINDWQMEIMAEVARFCRERQAVCHRAELVPQIAMLLSRKAVYRDAESPFAPWHGEHAPVRGTLKCLLDSQQVVEVLAEHQLAGRTSEYPLIVVSQWDAMEAGLRKELAAYVRGGGSLLLIGPKAARLFRKHLGVRLVGKPLEKTQYLEHEGRLAGHEGLWQKVKLGPKAKPFGRLFPDDDPKGPHEPAASVARLGKGKIAAVYADLSVQYGRGRTPLVRDFLASLVRKLFPRPIVEVVGSHNVDVVLARKDGNLTVNLVNTAGPHRDGRTAVYDEVPAVGPLEVTVRTRHKPREVRLYPGGRKLRHTYSRGAVRVRLPRLELHSAITVR